MALALGPTRAVAAPLGADVVAPVPHITLTDLGPAQGNGYLNLALQLKYRNQAALDRLTDAQIDSASPLYLHWLSNAQFNAAFAPSGADYNRALHSLERSGFRITQTYSNRTVIDAAAPISVAEHYFNTQIHRVMQPGYGIRFANSRPARVPADLRGLIVNVTGLNDLTFLHATNVSGAGRASRNVRSTSAGPLKGPYGGFGPLAFSRAYDLPVQHARGSGTYDGSGRKSAVLMDADFLESDLAGYLSYFNVTRGGPATVRIPIDGGSPPGLGSPDSVETTLDVETIVGNAPGTALYVYEFPSWNSNQYITDAYNRVVADNIVDVANSSFAGCEQGFSADAKAWDLLAQQGAAKGITFSASTGDRGSNQCNGLGVSAPASGPHFAAIGGTSLQTDANGNWDGESGWAGSGGGVSVVFSLPNYQKGVANTIASGRNLPDVSFDANPLTGAAFYYNGTFANGYDPLGGTSLSCPIFSAAVAEIDQVRSMRYGLAAELYRAWEKRGYARRSKTFFHDITAGSNNRYNATTGYDRVTGIVSLDVWNIVKPL
ncbi:MAG: S53 family peptidase [Candidatus Baltobacteraceae bacterium]